MKSSKIVILFLMFIFLSININAFLPDVCRGSDGIECLDKADIGIENQVITFKAAMINNLGKDIELLQDFEINGICREKGTINTVATFNYTSRKPGPKESIATFPVRITDGQSFMVALNCTYKESLGWPWRIKVYRKTDLVLKYTAEEKTKDLHIVSKNWFSHFDYFNSTGFLKYNFISNYGDRYKDISYDEKILIFQAILFIILIFAFYLVKNRFNFKLMASDFKAHPESLIFFLVFYFVYYFLFLRLFSWVEDRTAYISNILLLASTFLFFGIFIFLYYYFSLKKDKNANPYIRTGFLLIYLPFVLLFLLVILESKHMAVFCTLELISILIPSLFGVISFFQLKKGQNKEYIPHAIFLVLSPFFYLILFLIFILLR